MIYYNLNIAIVINKVISQLVSYYVKRQHTFTIKHNTMYYGKPKIRFTLKML